MKYLSICIPTYEMHGLGEHFLEVNFKILQKQTYKNFEIIISDHSSSDSIKNLCNKYKGYLDIKYFQNTNKLGNSPANTNNAIKKAKGKIIKILFQDDFLFHEEALWEIVQDFNLKSDHWLITACAHTTDGISFFRPFYPKYHNQIHTGRNTISSPSVLTIKNDYPLLFDENLIRRMDCDYYKRCFDKFGEPKILNKINVINRVGAHQISNTHVTNELRDREYKYILEKYQVKFPNLHILHRKIKKLFILFKTKIRNIILNK